MPEGEAAVLQDGGHGSECRVVTVLYGGLMVAQSLVELDLVAGQGGGAYCDVRIDRIECGLLGVGCVDGSAEFGGGCSGP